MTELLLSQFARNQNIRLTFKGTRGKLKKVHIGTEVYESEYLSILAATGSLDNTYSFRKSKSGGLVLTQDPEGDLKFTITSDIKTPCIAETPGPEVSKYIELCLRDGNVYVPLS